MGVHRQTIQAQLRDSCRVKESFSDELLARIETFAERSAEALARGGKLVFFGNGGSAADAQHLAAELTVRLRADRPSLAALALTVNSSVLTAAANDFGFDRIFERQIESLTAPGDVLVALSTSGNSPNVVRGLEAGAPPRRLLRRAYWRDRRRTRPPRRLAPKRSFQRSPAHSGGAHHHRPYRLRPDRADSLRHLDALVRYL